MEIRAVAFHREGVADRINLVRARHPTKLLDDDGEPKLPNAAVYMNVPYQKWD